MPLARPRPTRFGFLVAPGLGDRLCRVVPIANLYFSSLLDRLNCDEVANFANHPTGSGSIYDFDAIVDATQSQTLQQETLRLGTANAASNLSYFEFESHVS